jgi:hypothetical protein
MDATLNTNSQKIPLAKIVGVDNHARTFTVALNFILAEAFLNFDFILNALDKLFFYHSHPLPQVLISDQEPALQTALFEYPRWHVVIHQLCEWHMVQNIKAFIQRNRKYKQSLDLEDVWTAVWASLQCCRMEMLEERRQEMYTLFEQPERNYYSKNWPPDKQQHVL